MDGIDLFVDTLVKHILIIPWSLSNDLACFRGLVDREIQAITGK